VNWLIRPRGNPRKPAPEPGAESEEKRADTAGAGNNYEKDPIALKNL
jgi:hypothetical protein